jgi:hypothetical protein
LILNKKQTACKAYLDAKTIPDNPHDLEDTNASGHKFLNVNEVAGETLAFQ